MISIVQLEYIVAVDTYRHFVKAAEKCFVTQPTLSMQIKKLEEDLGVTIFDRSKQPIIPTIVGRKIIEQARITLAESRKIEELVNEYSNSVTGEITLGIIPSLAPYLLPLFIGKFYRKYPDVKLRVVEMLTEDLIVQLKKDLVDVAVLVSPLHENGIIEKPLFYEEMLFMVNKSHPLAYSPKVTVKDLASPDLWLMKTGHCFRSQVINLCNYHSDIKSSHIEYDSGSLDTIKKLVETEGGFTLIPELSADIKGEQVMIRPIENLSPLREVSFAYTRNYSKKKLLTLLAEEIKNSIPKDMLDKERGQIVEWRG
jgi:LysR family hydrogen peroxide-inducible transcriptional activator